MDITMSSPTKIKVGGYNAYRAYGSGDHSRYILTCVETEWNYIQIIAFCGEDGFDACEPLFLRITDSFRASAFYDPGDAPQSSDSDERTEKTFIICSDYAIDAPLDWTKAEQDEDFDGMQIGRSDPEAVVLIMNYETSDFSYGYDLYDFTQFFLELMEDYSADYIAEPYAFNINGFKAYESYGFSEDITFVFNCIEAGDYYIAIASFCVNDDYDLCEGLFEQIVYSFREASYVDLLNAMIDELDSFDF